MELKELKVVVQDAYSASSEQATTIMYAKIPNSETGAVKHSFLLTRGDESFGLVLSNTELDDLKDLLNSGLHHYG